MLQVVKKGIQSNLLVSSLFLASFASPGGPGRFLASCAHSRESSQTGQRLRRAVCCCKGRALLQAGTGKGEGAVRPACQALQALKWKRRLAALAR